MFSSLSSSFCRQIEALGIGLDSGSQLNVKDSRTTLEVEFCCFWWSDRRWRSRHVEKNAEHLTVTSLFAGGSCFWKQTVLSFSMTSDRCLWKQTEKDSRAGSASSLEEWEIMFYSEFILNQTAVSLKTLPFTFNLVSLRYQLSRTYLNVPLCLLQFFCFLNHPSLSCSQHHCFLWKDLPLLYVTKCELTDTGVPSEPP